MRASRGSDAQSGNTFEKKSLAVAAGRYSPVRLLLENNESTLWVEIGNASTCCLRRRAFLLASGGYPSYQRVNSMEDLQETAP